ncbi:hypothetical protein CTEN210_03638 [Chaetoceros tenuissimus]|uniref:Uncharacterized protein n=1 Tax=Chaetoceros tenuissimus TaxID=426638 RepID=A0AAD3H200_9STRA|nr:hypothetical protein CTEN210_03638 [Chaetoceros tenuissimus]
MKTTLQSIFFAVISLSQLSSALITGNIKIVGKSGGQSQFLPGSYVNNFPRWHVEIVGEETINLTRLIGSGIDRNTEEVQTIAQEFVDPSSNEELCSGIPSYVLAGIEVRVPSHIAKDGREWKNFGMNSQPLASQWTTFDIAIENGFRVELFHGETLLKNQKDNGEQDEIQWTALMKDSCSSSDEIDSIQKQEQLADKAKDAQNAMGVMGNLLAGLDENSPIASGMHIVSVPTSSEWIDLPQTKDEDGYKLVSVATVESDAKELMTMDEDLIALSATSVLKVDVTRIAPGSKSEYMPNVYKPLYL